MSKLRAFEVLRGHQNPELSFFFEAAGDSDGAAREIIESGQLFEIHIRLSTPVLPQAGVRPRGKSTLHTLRVAEAPCQVLK